ncbi:pilus assembly protein [Qipengyuania gaetbuli]|uniref:TadE/TadG family type IV pilus assembly protein n=1 Tax=Qipengyuania gaetbuli TaxID=266952 RepID=UPI001C99A095|nr:TadE/TadG family type IV pilus assembly protein [Qipengyuania gaetbuli]MBY6015519.1 pilus assembly protein [Qipengyuania gaetbuli]
MKSLRIFALRNDGAAAAEMALMLPLLMVMLFGGFEAGHYLYTEQKIVQAVREGARYAGRRPFADYPCPGNGTTPAADAIQTVTQTGTLSGGTPRIANWDKGLITVTYTCNTSYAGQGIFKGSAGGAPVVTVTAAATYPSLFGALGLIDDTYQVRSSAQAVVNGI